MSWLDRVVFFKIGEVTGFAQYFARDIRWVVGGHHGGAALLACGTEKASLPPAFQSPKLAIGWAQSRQREALLFEELLFLVNDEKFFAARSAGGRSVCHRF
jgi:hypothetical protein